MAYETDPYNTPYPTDPTAAPAATDPNGLGLMGQQAQIQAWYQ